MALKEKYKDQVVFITVDTSNREASTELLRTFSVLYLPTYYFINSAGQVVGEEVGAKAEEFLANKIQELLLNQ